MRNKIKKIVNTLGSPKFFAIISMWLMVLVVIGTLVQRDYGLYLAQQKYFSSWFTFLSFIPIPSGRTVMFLMVINLSCYFFRPNIFKKNKLGVTIVHSGVVMLLAGGGLTAIFSSEGNMVIKEGSRSNFIEDYYLKEFAIVNTSDPNFDKFIIFDQPLLKQGKILSDNSVPFTIEVLDYYNNIEVMQRIYRGDEHLKGMAKNFYLDEKVNEKEFEKNISGMVYRISNAGSDLDGDYITFLGQPVTQSINVGEEEYLLLLRRKRTYVPFYLELIDFKKILHPGTNIAKSFSSDINLYENNISRKVLIQMNEPLRHRGYTFYQASFIEGGDIETTVLASVKNYGRVFPYISTIIMCIGLLFHIYIKLSSRIIKVKK